MVGLPYGKSRAAVAGIYHPPRLWREVDIRTSGRSWASRWRGAQWHANRLLRTIKEEEVDLSNYEDYDDAARQLGWFLDEVYVHKRIHSSLGYLTPAAFEEQWRREQLGVALFTKNRSERVQFSGGGTTISQEEIIQYEHI